MQALTEPSAVLLHTPDWQTAGPVATVQAPSPLLRPQRALPPQMFAVHWLALVHATPFATPHVLATALHAPVAHTSPARVGPQTPLWMASTGRGAPAARSAWHRSVFRLQWLGPAQSAST